MKRPDFLFSHVIPAQPGFYVLSVEAGRKDFPATVFRNPVVAWAIEEGSWAPYPMTPQGVQTNYPPIECPNELVVEMADAGWWANAAEWLAFEQQSYAAARNIDVEQLATLRHQALTDHGEPVEEVCQ